ncbi:hypothetical protein AMEX_G21739 [Astyanax mexicanus]|uniref:Galactose-3-O-sulfotransferase 2 n=1 Tax=Astyanax mexicanus TaxID=7994 RepID=A0A8T2L5X2_ASTMX|nr:hypothetical protein AMEX_G21739 [Astyanax mexicanus]
MCVCVCYRCGKKLSCIHLRFVWQVLTVLTVVCVALQLLGVVRQARNTKVIGPADDQLGFKHLPAVQQNGGSLQSFPTTLNPNQRDYQLFKWEHDKTLDTTPSRRFTTTLKKILLQHGHRLASKSSPSPADPNDVQWVYSEMLKQSPAENKKWENIPRKYPEDLSEDEPDIYPDVITPAREPEPESPAENKILEKLPTKHHEIPTKDKPVFYQEMVKLAPAKNVKLNNLLRLSSEVPSKDKLRVYQETRSQNQNSEKTLPRKIPEVPSKELLNPYSFNANSHKQAVNVLSHDENGKCRPKEHIVFLKTHKTASSTILNMLYRYGDTRNLTFALPVNMHSQLYYPNFFLAYFVEGLRFNRVKQFHIMCNHMRFRGPEVRKVMPVDTFYFSILRNPVFMMESLFTYYKGIPAFRNYRTLTQFLMDGGRAYNASVFNNHYARNVLTFDFGLNSTAPENDVELDKRSADLIATVESNFHLILISEYFDESMILLKHSLCWTLEDVVSFRLNSRNAKSRTQLSPLLDEHIKQWNSLDWRLYQHFNATFWRRIDTMLGREKLQEEVELLRARRAELEQTCLLGGGAVDPEKVQDSSLKPFQYGQAVIQGYNIRPGLNNETHQLCQRLIMPELQYTKALYVKQFPDLVAQHEAEAKLAAAKRLAAAQRSLATTRHSAGNKSALKNNLKYKTQAQTVQKTHQQKPISEHYATTVGRLKPSKETQPKLAKQSEIEHNVPPQT